MGKNLKKGGLKKRSLTTSTTSNTKNLEKAY